MGAGVVLRPRNHLDSSMVQVIHLSPLPPRWAEPATAGLCRGSGRQAGESVPPALRLCSAPLSMVSSFQAYRCAGGKQMKRKTLSCPCWSPLGAPSRQKSGSCPRPSPVQLPFSASDMSSAKHSCRHRQHPVSHLCSWLPSPTVTFPMQ